MQELRKWLQDFYKIVTCLENFPSAKLSAEAADAASTIKSNL